MRLLFQWFGALVELSPERSSSPHLSFIKYFIDVFIRQVLQAVLFIISVKRQASVSRANSLNKAGSCLTDCVVMKLSEAFFLYGRIIETLRLALEESPRPSVQTMIWSSP